MAPKASRRSTRSQRLAYVRDDSPSSSAEMNSSEDDSFVIEDKRKVRKDLSIRHLLKDSENFQAGDDHIYTKYGAPAKYELKDSVLKSKDTKSDVSNQRRKRKVESDVDDSVDFLPSKRQKCFSKNAIMARMNRERKKQYISTLENDNKILRNEHDNLYNKVEHQGKVISTLKREVIYLKGLLANSKEICQILQGLNKSTGLPVSSSLQPMAKNTVKLSPEHGYVSGSECADVQSTSTLHSQPRVKSVTTGSNFPISADDINLGSFSLTSGDDDDDILSPLKDLDDLNEPNFMFENDSILGDAFINDFNKLDNFGEGSSLFDIPFDTPEKSNTYNDHMPLCEDILSASNVPDVGICLHVNKKRISVEMCSLCSNKASACWQE